MSEKRITNILKNHGVQVYRFAGRLWAIEEYTWKGIPFADPVPVDPDEEKVDGMPVYWWLGY